MFTRGLLSLAIVSTLVIPLSPIAIADESRVIDVKSDCDEEICRFAVTLEHGDTGWDHYANHWRIMTLDGKELGRRVLHHPHVNEQPFTRSLNNVTIPMDITEVIIESHDSVHEYGGDTLQIKIR